MSQANELGITMLGVPEELGGAALRALRGHLRARHREARRTATWASPLAALSPAAVATAIGLWGDSGQQGTYLPDSSATTFPPRRSRFRSRARSSIRSSSRRPRPSPETASCSTARSRSSPAASSRSSSCRRRPRRPPGALHRRGRDEGRPRRAAARDGPAPRRDGEPEARWRERRRPRRLLGDGDPERLRGLHPSRAASPGRRLPSAPHRRSVDYVVPYVNERIAFGEPISHRQAVAFKVADMATELEGMRLVMLRAASRVDQGLDFSPRVRARPPHRRPEGHADRLGRRPAPGRARLHQGTPGRALVSRLASRRRGGRRCFSSNGHSISKHPRSSRSSPSRRTRSRRKCCARSRASTTRPSTSIRRSSTCWPR